MTSDALHSESVRARLQGGGREGKRDGTKLLQLTCVKCVSLHDDGGESRAAPTR